MAGWESAAEEVDIAQLPADCETFFIYDSNVTEEEKADNTANNYKADILAFRIANECGVRTLNGIGSVFLFDTFALFDVYGEGYLEHIADWVIHYKLSGVYGYDIETGCWKSLNEVLQGVLYVLNEGFSNKEYDNENTWYWAVGLTSKIKILNPLGDAENIRFSFSTTAAPDGSKDKIDIYINDRFAQSVHEGDTVDLDMQIDANSEKIIRIVSHGSLSTVEGDVRTFAYELLNPVIEIR